MQNTGFIVLLLLGVFVPNAFGKTLCGFLLSKPALSKFVADRTLTEREQQQIVNRVTSYLQKMGIRKYKNHEIDDPYKKLMVRTTKPEQSFISDIYYDASLVLRVPEASEKTVWSVLSPKYRTYLVEVLLDQFKQGNYEIRDERDDFDILKNHSFYMKLKKEKIGFSPLKVLGAASLCETTGECRLSNSAFSGLLLELGFPPSDIRLVSSILPGAKSGHVWVEYRSGANKPWVEADATGRSYTDKKPREFEAMDSFQYKKNREAFFNQPLTILPSSHPSYPRPLSYKLNFKNKVVRVVLHTDNLKKDARLSELIEDELDPSYRVDLVGTWESINHAIINKTAPIKAISKIRVNSGSVDTANLELLPSLVEIGIPLNLKNVEAMISLKKKNPAVKVSFWGEKDLEVPIETIANQLSQFPNSNFDFYLSSKVRNKWESVFKAHNILFSSSAMENEVVLQVVN